MTGTEFLTAEDIASLLDEPNVYLVRGVIRCLGAPRAEALLEDTLAIELAGGMLVRDGSRRRTPGGVFFHLVRQDVDVIEARWIFWSALERRALREVFPRAPRPPRIQKTPMAKPMKPTHQHMLRPVKGPSVTVEGVVLMAPLERHTNSVWRVLKTTEGQLVRFTMATTGEITKWVDTGHHVRITGHLLAKDWKDGIHQSVSAHHAVEIVDMAQAV